MQAKLLRCRSAPTTLLCNIIFVDVLDLGGASCTRAHVPHPTNPTQTQALATHIAGYSRRVLSLGKAAFYQQQAMGTDDAYAHASCIMTDNLAGVHDAREGISAFLDKRTPIWTHT